MIPSITGHLLAMQAQDAVGLVLSVLAVIYLIVVLIVPERF